MVTLSGPRPEGGMGGPGGVGEGHAAVAVCPAGPGEAVPPASAQHRLQQPGSVPRGEASQGDPSQLHGIWSTGKKRALSFDFCLMLQTWMDVSRITDYWLSLFFDFRWQCFWNSRRLPITLNPQTKKIRACLNFEDKVLHLTLSTSVFYFSCVHCDDAVHVQDQTDPLKWL